MQNKDIEVIIKSFNEDGSECVTVHKGNAFVGAMIENQQDGCGVTEITTGAFSMATYAAALEALDNLKDNTRKHLAEHIKEECQDNPALSAISKVLEAISALDALDKEEEKVNPETVEQARSTDGAIDISKFLR